MYDIYRRLENGHIRLLSISAGDPSSDICCQFIPVDLTTKPKFAALSYAWGPEPAEHKITLNKLPFQVRESLWQFLKHARDTALAAPKLLWIDALCIDQTNNIERTQQVGLMPSIFASAYLVLAWLGPAQHNSGDAMQYIGNTTIEWEAEAEKSIALWSTSCSVAICSLCSAPYWRRLWVFPELMLAQRTKLMCGSVSIPWHCLEMFLTKLYAAELPEHVADTFQCASVLTSPAMDMVRQVALRHENQSMYELMCSTKRLRCSEPEDRVYALLGIPGLTQTDMKPDYAANMTTILNKVLRSHHQQYPPRSIEEVQSSCQRLAEMVGLQHASIFALPGCPEEMVPDEQVMSAYPLNYQDTHINSWWALFHDHERIQRLLIKALSKVLKSYLFQAIRAGDLAAFEALLLVGADTAAIDSSKGRHRATTTLHAAIRGSNPAIVKRLLQDERLHVNSFDVHGKTPLYLAAYSGNIQIVKLLLETGECDVNQSCIRAGNIDYGDRSTPLHAAVERGYLGIVKLLYDNANRRINEESVPASLLHVAVLAKQESVTAFLINETGAFVRQQMPKTRDTPVHWALKAFLPSPRCLELLLDADPACVNDQNDSGQTPLHLAADRYLCCESQLQFDRYRACVKVLLETETINPDIEDNENDKASDVLASMPYEEVQKLLRDARARWQARSQTMVSREHAVEQQLAGEDTSGATQSAPQVHDLSRNDNCHLILPEYRRREHSKVLP